MLPFAHAEIAMLRRKAESRALIVLPLTLVTGAEGVAVVAVAVGFEPLVELACVDAGRVVPRTGDKGIMVPPAHYPAAE